MFKIWLAGFLDADGSVGLSKRGKLDYQRRPEVEFYNCDAILLQSIIDVYGGKIVKRTYSNPKWNDSYSFGGKSVGNVKNDMKVWVKLCRHGPPRAAMEWNKV